MFTFHASDMKLSGACGQIRSSLEHAASYEAHRTKEKKTTFVSSVAPQNMRIILSIRLIRVALEIPNWLGNFGTDKKDDEQLRELQKEIKTDPSLHSCSSVMNLK